MSWLLEGACKDEQSITSDWEFTALELIHGVRFYQMKNVPKESGYLTEVYRRAWEAEDLPVDQVFQVLLHPGERSGWHTHRHTTDRLFVSVGLAKIVLYDAREDSPTKGRLNTFRLGTLRPGLVVIPPKVWHGIRNIAPESALILNLVDRAYDYESPDHWRLPPDSPQVPYTL